MYIVRFTRITMVNPNAYTQELRDGRRRYGRLEDMAFEKFKGSCIVKIVHAFSGKGYKGKMYSLLFVLGLC